MNNILLETINLKKTYEHVNGNITLFNNLNLKIKCGDLIALVGPSGSGKSSLLHLLALLDEPTKGKILINNNETKNLTDIQKDEIRRINISIIFQENNLLTDFTALENVMMPLIIKGENKKDILVKAQNILKDLKIFNRSNHFPSELSGGEQQRVAIARALIAETNLIIDHYQKTFFLESPKLYYYLELIKSYHYFNSYQVFKSSKYFKQSYNYIEILIKMQNFTKGFIILYGLVFVNGSVHPAIPVAQVVETR